MIKRLPFYTIAILLLGATPAMAVQVHGPPEGYFAHMMAHIFYSAALIFFLFILHKKPPNHGMSWKYLKLSLFFFLLWNFDTFTVHWISHELPNEAFISGQNLLEDKLAYPLTFDRILYYAGRFDHLLCLPAIWFLMHALGDFCRAVEQRIRDQKA